MYHALVNLQHLIAWSTLKECKAHWSDSVKTCSAINPIKQLLPKRLPSLTCHNQHSAFNIQASAHCIQGCLVVSYPCRCEALSRKQHIFEVCFIALDKDLTHATMLNSFVQNVLNFLQNRWQCCYCTPTWNFSSIWWLLLYRSTAHSTLHSLKCGIMPCLAEN